MYANRPHQFIRYTSPFCRQYHGFVGWNQHFVSRSVDSLLSHSFNHLAFSKTMSSAAYHNEFPIGLVGKDSVNHDCDEVQRKKARRHSAHGYGDVNYLDSLLCNREVEYTGYGRKFYNSDPSRVNDWLEFSVASYNILAQNLLEDNIHLYPYCPQKYLDWSHRSQTLLKELKYHMPDILCLQEVMETHYYEFLGPELAKLGYSGTYKKKTGDNTFDGCAILYKRGKFSCVKSVPVEYFMPDVEVLDRHNVGLLVLLKPVKGVRRLDQFQKPIGPPNMLCVATTHLLFNPKRGDVKLAQLMTMFAEIDKLTHLPVTADRSGPSYHPTIFCGDLNSEPFSDLYHFVTDGRLNCKDIVVQMMCSDRSSPVSFSRSMRFLSPHFLDPAAQITDRCQYLSVCRERSQATPPGDVPVVSPGDEDHSGKDATADSMTAGLLLQCSGSVTHQFGFKSVYSHVGNGGDSAVVNGHVRAYKALKQSVTDPEVTTCHRAALSTVDYMFYTPCRSRTELVESEKSERLKRLSCEQLRVLSRLALPTRSQLSRAAGLPCRKLASDHVILMAKFALRLFVGTALR